MDSTSGASRRVLRADGGLLVLSVALFGLLVAATAAWLASLADR